MSAAGADEKKQTSGYNAENMSVTPTDDDILLGRGRFAQYNPGNVRFRTLTAKYKDAYDTAPGRRRNGTVSEVCSVLRSEWGGRRFLKQIDTDVWVNCVVFVITALIHRVS